MEYWYAQKGVDGTALLSFVTLCRNFEGLPFPVRLTRMQKDSLSSHVTAALAAASMRVTCTRMNTLYPYEAVSLADRRLITPAFAGAPDGASLVMAENEQTCLMLCDEDHVRIRALSAGLKPEAAYGAACRYDDALGARLGWAFSPRLGYLNQDPSNLGTGMYAGVLLHLPALSRTGAIPALVSMASRLGFRMQGAYGDGFSVSGDLFSVENTLTMGLSEERALSNLRSFCLQISTRERAAAESIAEDITVIDRVRRSWALLNSASLLTTEETMQMVSDVRMGAIAGKIAAPVEKLNSLFVLAQPATVNCAAGQKLPRHERDALRAEIVKKTLG